MVPTVKAVPWCPSVSPMCLLHILILCLNTPPSSVVWFPIASLGWRRKFFCQFKNNIHPRSFQTIKKTKNLKKFEALFLPVKRQYRLKNQPGSPSSAIFFHSTVVAIPNPTNHGHHQPFAPFYCPSLFIFAFSTPPPPSYRRSLSQPWPC